ELGVPHDLLVVGRRLEEIALRERHVAEHREGIDVPWIEPESAAGGHLGAPEILQVLVADAGDVARDAAARALPFGLPELALEQLDGAGVIAARHLSVAQGAPDL